MAKEEALTVTGTVVKVEKNGFIVDCSLNEDKPHLVKARIAGKLRKNYIRIVIGDEVDVEVSPYDVHMGRITYRKK